MPAIRPFSNALHRSQVIALWESSFGYSTTHNRPDIIIDKKLKVRDGLFFVALDDTRVIGTVIAGYDGHRGWLYSLAVAPLYQRKRVGTLLVAHAERALAKRGCVKINLQILGGNEKVIEFYKALGFSVENRISMGKTLKENLPAE